MEEINKQIEDLQKQKASLEMDRHIQYWLKEEKDAKKAIGKFVGKHDIYWDNVVWFVQTQKGANPQAVEDLKILVQIKKTRSRDAVDKAWAEEAVKRLSPYGFAIEIDKSSVDFECAMCGEKEADLRLEIVDREERGYEGHTYRVILNVRREKLFFVDFFANEKFATRVNEWLGKNEITVKNLGEIADALSFLKGVVNKDLSVKINEYRRPMLCAKCFEHPDAKQILSQPQFTSQESLDKWAKVGLGEFDWVVVKKEENGA